MKVKRRGQLRMKFDLDLRPSDLTFNLTAISRVHLGSSYILLTASFHFSILESFREQMIDIARDFNAQIAKNPVGEHDFLGNASFILTPQSSTYSN